MVQAQQSQEDYNETMMDHSIGKCHIVFIIQLPRVAGGCFVGFQGGHWLSVHIDDLRPQKDRVSILTLKNKSVSSLFEEAILADSPSSTIVARMLGIEENYEPEQVLDVLEDEETGIDSESEQVLDVLEDEETGIDSEPEQVLDVLKEEEMGTEDEEMEANEGEDGEQQEMETDTTQVLHIFSDLLM